MTLTLGDLFRSLREPVERLAAGGDVQVRYLEDTHVDGDELWNELDDSLLTALVDLRPHGVLGAATLDALSRLQTGAHDLYDHDLGTDAHIRTHPKWAEVRVLAAKALRVMNADAKNGKAPWLSEPWHFVR